MRYDILYHWKLEELTKAVNKGLREGWQLQGGVSVSYNGSTGGAIFAQAMVLPEETDKEKGSE